MVMRTKDWFRQAEKDLQHAKRSVDAGDFEWACFAAQQAAEKAVKSLYQSVHIDAIGHSISRMLQDLPASLKPLEGLMERAKELDKHYIPSRYPNFHPEGAPLDYYTEPEARRAVEGADKIIEFCRGKIPKDQLR
jgi:HEPN domain-containing protein